MTDAQILLTFASADLAVLLQAQDCTGRVIDLASPEFSGLFAV